MRKNQLITERTKKQN